MKVHEIDVQCPLFWGLVGGIAAIAALSNSPLRGVTKDTPLSAAIELFKYPWPQTGLDMKGRTIHIEPEILGLDAYRAVTEVLGENVTVADLIAHAMTMISKGNMKQAA